MGLEIIPKLVVVLLLRFICKQGTEVVSDTADTVPTEREVGCDMVKTQIVVESQFKHERKLPPRVLTRYFCIVQKPANHVGIFVSLYGDLNRSFQLSFLMFCHQFIEKSSRMNTCMNFVYEFLVPDLSICMYSKLPPTCTSPRNVSKGVFHFFFPLFGSGEGDLTQECFETEKETHR